MIASGFIIRRKFSESNSVFTILLHKNHLSWGLGNEKCDCTNKYGRILRFIVHEIQSNTAFYQIKIFQFHALNGP